MKLLALLTRTRIKRCIVVGVTTGSLVCASMWLIALPTSRFKSEIGSQPPASQSLIGFSPQGGLLVNAGYRGAPSGQVLRIWNVASRETAPGKVIPLASLHSVGDFWNSDDIQVSPDDREMMVRLDGRNSLQFISTETGEQTAT